MNKETIKQINENLKELEIGFKQAEEHYNYDLGNEKHYLSEVTRLVKNLSLSGVVGQSEQLLCKHCDNKKALHSRVSELCPNMFKHFEAK